MIPILLISRDLEKTKKFVDSYIKENSINPHLIFSIIPESKELSINQIREIKKEIVTTTDQQRLFILYNFESASAEAQNALLKTLEESTLRNHFILIADNENIVLPTIRSRTKIHTIQEISLSQKDISAITTLLDSLSTHNDYTFFANALTVNPSKESVVSLLDEMILYYRHKLATQTSAGKIIDYLMKTKYTLIHNNLNPQLTLDTTILFIKKQ